MSLWWLFASYGSILIQAFSSRSEGRVRRSPQDWESIYVLRSIIAAGRRFEAWIACYNLMYVGSCLCGEQLSVLSWTFLDMPVAFEKLR